MDFNCVPEEDFEQIDNIANVESRLKCGEIMLINNRKVSFCCTFCGIGIQTIGAFLRHILKQHLTFSKEDFDALLVNAKRKQAAKNEQNIDIEDIQYDEELLMDVKVAHKEIKIEENIVDDHEEQKMISSYQQNFESVSHKSEIEEYLLPQQPKLDEQYEDMELLEEFFTEVPNGIKEDNSSNEVGFEIEVLPCANTSERFANTSSEDPPCTVTQANEVLIPEIVSTTPRVFCKICKKVFRNEDVLSVHMERHSEATERPYLCEYCEARFAHRSNFNVHVNRHLGIKSFTCKECDKGFYSTTELKLHQVCHTGVRKYKCNDCDRTFARRQMLVAHSRRHYDERPYECKECCKKYFTSHQLRAHAASHKQERPFSCEVCGATFKRRKALNEHSKLHAAIKKYKCKMCARSFAQYAGLYSHMKTHSKDT